MDVLVSDSNHLLLDQWREDGVVNGFHSGREEKMVEGRDNGLDSLSQIYSSGKASESHSAPYNLLCPKL